MAVKIRFARIGKKHAPIYRIVAIDSRRKRDGMFLENLGTYNPKTKQIVQFHDDRVAHWISVGAIPTDAVGRLIAIRAHKKANLAPVESEVSVEKKAAKKPAAKKTTKKSDEQ